MSTTASSSATLEKTPLLHLLVSMADRQMSGTVLFDTPGGSSSAIVFERGAPRKSSAAPPHCRLSDLLIEFGWLDAHSAAETYAMALEQQEPHGQVLLDCHLVDPPGLSHVLQYQLLRKLDWIASRPPETQLDLREDVDLLDSVPPGPFDASPLAILWAIAKNHVNERNKRVVFTRFANRPLQLHRNCIPELFGFNDAEMTLVDRLRHVRMDIGSLLYQLELPKQTAEALLYVLLLTRHIDIGDGRTPIGVPAPEPSFVPQGSGEYRSSGMSATILPKAFEPATILPKAFEPATILPKASEPTTILPKASQPATITPTDELTSARPLYRRQVTAEPVDASPAHEKLSRDLCKLASEAKSLDHYSLLGVPRDAPIATIRVAFTALTQRFHPDRLPAELRDQRPIAAQLLACLMNAYRTLADETRRANYDAMTPPPSSGAARARVAKRGFCADALRRAEQLLKRERIALAEAEAAQAIELDPTNPHCMALHAWIRSLKPDGQDHLASILDSLTQALDLDPMNVQTRFYRSQILKRLDRIDEAVGEWRLIIELSPSHIDAQRELRLWEMRRGSSRPPKNAQSGTHRQVSVPTSSLGLFGRLFRGSR